MGSHGFGISCLRFDQRFGWKDVFFVEIVGLIWWKDLFGVDFDVNFGR